jgi:plastocyanin
MKRFVPLLLALGLLVAGTATAQTTHTVNLGLSSFNPPTLTIEQGDTVTWNNSGANIHNVNGTTASYPGNPEGFTSGTAAPGPWTFSFTFETPGVYDYHCDVHGAPGVGMRGRITVEPATSDSPLLISEYVEGTSFNKALEIYNPSDDPVDLAAGNYSIAVYFNGNTDPGTTVALTGTIAPDDVFVFSEDSADPAILAVADQTFNGPLWNGNDAVVLFQGFAVVDVIGEVGFDPITEWGTGDTSTADNTIRREGDACTADTDTSDVFDPAVNYTGYPLNTFTGLGNADELDCGSPACAVAYQGAVTGTVTGGGGTPRRVRFTGTVNNSGATPRSVSFTLNYNRKVGGNPGPPQGSRRFGPFNYGPGANAFNLTIPVPANAPAGTYNWELVLEDKTTAPPQQCGSQAGQVVLPPARVAGGGEALADFIGDDATFESYPVGSSSVTAPAEVVVSPNPLSHSATVSFSLAEAAQVRLAVYDMLGREVAVLVDGQVGAGSHTAVFEAGSLAAGTYVYRLAAGDHVETGRLTVAR